MTALDRVALFVVPILGMLLSVLVMVLGGVLLAEYGPSVESVAAAGILLIGTVLLVMCSWMLCDGFQARSIILLRRPDTLKSIKASFACHLAHLLMVHHNLPNDGTARYVDSHRRILTTFDAPPFHHDVGTFVQQARQAAGAELFTSPFKRKAVRTLQLDVVTLPQLSAHDRIACARVLSTLPPLPIPA